jgi:hypothetical protein
VIRQPVWTLWKREISLVPGTEPRFIGLSVSTIVTALTEIVRRNYLMFTDFLCKYLPEMFTIFNWALYSYSITLVFDTHLIKLQVVSISWYNLIDITASLCLCTKFHASAQPSWLEKRHTFATLTSVIAFHQHFCSKRH